MVTQNSKQILFDLWASFYDLWLPSIFYRAIHTQMLNAVDLPRQAQVLDIGCGTGRLLDRLATQYTDLQGTGLDLSAKMLRQARRSNHHQPRLIFVQGQASSLPFADQQFDAVFSTFSFLHYPDPEQVLAEIHRVLCLGGQFYWVDPTPSASTEMAQVDISPGDIHLYDGKMRENLGRQAGFRSVRQEILLGFNLLSILAKTP